ncbi:hypothetical protein FGIG_08127 [Fasciola gigantica]|uniref:Uncharacterized protein n=1 Tax=Fasciola gigantica TaxID=46835 RepID=A0A504YWQ7_FASGI|nr:hypothetical protein FGIG_08127 [Fasciola gigantica]
MILTLSGLKEYILQPIIRKLKLSDESILIYCILKILDELWVTTSAQINKNPHSTLHLCEKISVAIISAVLQEEVLLDSEQLNLKEDLDLLASLDVEPVIECNKQPSTLSAFVLGEYVMTPDVRPSDRRPISEFVMKPLGSIWNMFLDEIDESTMKLLDANYQVPSEDMDFYRELLKTCSNEHVDLKIGNNRMHCPSSLEMLPLIKFARAHSELLLQKPLIKHKAPLVNKWLPVDKQRNQGFSLHDEEAFVKVLDDLVMPESALDSVFADEIQLWKKNRNSTVKESEMELFIIQIKDQLEHERKTYYEGGKQLREDTFRERLQHEEGQWNPKIIFPSGLITLGHVQSEKMERCEEKISLLEQQIELLQQPGCCIKYSGKKPELESRTDFKALQARLEEAWGRLQIPEAQRIQLLANLCLMADHRYEMITMSQPTWKFVQLWEQAAQDVTKRESMLMEEANTEIQIIDPTLYGKADVIAQQAVAAEQRAILQTKFLAINERLHETAGVLNRDYNCVLTYRGEPYLDKMKHDRSDLQYHIHLFCTTVQTRNQTLGKK